MDKTTVESAGRPLTGFVRWFLLTGNRILVSIVILFGIGTAFVVVGGLELATVTTPSRNMWHLNGTVNGLLTLIPISVGVNQIVLSHDSGQYRISTNVGLTSRTFESASRIEPTPQSVPRTHPFFRNTSLVRLRHCEDVSARTQFLSISRPDTE